MWEDLALTQKSRPKKPNEAKEVWGMGWEDMDLQGLSCQYLVQFQKLSLRKKGVMCPGMQTRKCVVSEMC